MLIKVLNNIGVVIDVFVLMMETFDPEVSIASPPISLKTLLFNLFFLTKLFKVFSNLFPDSNLNTVDLISDHIERCKYMNKDRTKKKAEDLKNNFSYLEIIDWGETPEFDMIINATSLGLNNNDEIKHWITIDRKSVV